MWSNVVKFRTALAVWHAEGLSVGLSPRMEARKYAGNKQRGCLDATFETAEQQLEDPPTTLERRLPRSCAEASASTAVS